MDNQSSEQPLKVVQWATGNIGTRSLRAVIEHPHMELVGLYVHSDDKVGQDAGELCGMEVVGIKATQSLDDIIATGADCVLYMPQGTHIDELCSLLAAGINVVTTRGDFHHPRSMEPALRERVDAACRQGNTSIYSTGSSPGFITEALPLVLTSLQRRLDGLVIDEFADLSRRDSPELLFDIMGFGKPPAAFNEAHLAHLKEAFYPSLSQLADALSLPLDDVQVSGEAGAVRKDVQIDAGIIEKGTVGAQRITVVGLRADQPLMLMRLNWYCTQDTDKGWDLRETGWRVQVQGDTPLDVSITFPITMEQMAATTPGYTAHRAVNAVAAVCVADAGIRTTVDLPQIIADLGE